MTSDTVFLGIAAVAVAFSLYFKLTRSLLNHFITVVHEFGHAIAALFLGGKVQGIKINSDGSGVTMSGHEVNMSYIPVRIVTLLSGYSFPIFLGIGLLWAWFNNYIVAGVITLAIVSLLSFVFLRNFFALFVMVLFSAITVGTFFLPWTGYPYMLASVSLVFLILGLKDAGQISKAVFQKRPELNSDFNLLRDQTHIPAQVWVIIFWAIQIALLTAFLLLTGLLKV